MDVLHVRRVNGYAKGEFTIKDDRSSPSQPTLGKLVFEDNTGAKEVIDFSKAASLNTLGAETIIDSTAVDVAGLVTDFNALLAVLRTAGVIQ